jgi:site-specific recombinase XerD
LSPSSIARVISEPQPATTVVKEVPAWQSFLGVSGWNSSSPAVDRLLKHLARRSRSNDSRTEYCRHLYRLCLHSNRIPEQLVKLRRDHAEHLIQEYADIVSSKSPRSANIAISTLKTYFTVNGYRGTRALMLETYHVPRRLRSRTEYVPSRREAHQMADCAGSLRDRASILLLFTSGIRNSTMRSLLVGDIIDELERGLSIIRIPVYRRMKERVASACKGGIEYTTFISEDASQALRLYLADRRMRFGSVERTEPLFSSEYNQVSLEERRTKFLTSRQVQIVVKCAARNAGIERWREVHPHSLRKSFATTLRSQLVDGGLLDVKTQEILMGHTLPGSMDNYFDFGRTEDLRLLYSKLIFSRPTIENPFHTLKMALARTFADTNVDIDGLLREYVKTLPHNQTAAGGGRPEGREGP